MIDRAAPSFCEIVMRGIPKLRAAERVDHADAPSIFICVAR